MPFALQLTNRSAVRTSLPALPTCLHRKPPDFPRKAPCYVAHGSAITLPLGSVRLRFIHSFLLSFHKWFSVVCCVLDMARDAGHERNVQNGHGPGDSLVVL